MSSTPLPGTVLRWRQKEQERYFLAGKTTQHLIALPILAEDLGSVPSTHSMAYNHLLTQVSRESDSLCWSQWASATAVVQTWMQVKHPYAEK